MRKEEILIICPTRDRPEKAIDAYKALKKTSTKATICFVVDEDQKELYQEITEPYFDCLVLFVKKHSMVYAINEAAKRYARYYEYIGFIGDDHRFVTKGWDEIMMSEFKKNNKFGIFYGNDLIQGENLPTQVVMSSFIVSKLHYFAPPILRHLYVDNFWKQLGKELGILKYFPEIIIEHMHYTVGKAEADELYLKNNSGESFNNDAKAFAEYIEKDFQRDVNKLSYYILQNEPS